MAENLFRDDGLYNLANLYELSPSALKSSTQSTYKINIPIVVVNIDYIRICITIESII
jgi:hypothetical protein